MALADIIGTMGFLAVFGLISAPCPSLVNGIRTGEIKNLSLTYFITGLVQSTGWANYGHMIKDFNIYIANDVAFVVFLIYINMFLYIYKQIKEMAMYSVGFCLFYLICRNLCPVGLNLLVASAISFVWNCSLIPLIKKSLETKDASYLNILLAGFSFLNYFLWTFYGILVNNVSIIITNSWALLLWTINIFVYFWTNNHIANDNICISFLKKIFFVQETSTDNLDSFFKYNQHNEKNINSIFDLKTTSGK
jgi:uncharacterized protein with PQ loop repeat